MPLSILCLAAFSPSPWYVHIKHSSRCALLFHSPHLTVPLQSFFCRFLGRLHNSCCPSNVFISDVNPPCDQAHPSQRPRLLPVVLLVPLLLPRSLHNTTELVWPQLCKLSLRFHWHPPVIQHSTESRPVPPCCTHSLRNCCCCVSCLLHAWTEILKIVVIPLRSQPALFLVHYPVLI